MKSIQLLALVSLLTYATQVICAEGNNITQEKYLERFEAAKKDIYFCRFVNSFTQKTDENESLSYDLPPRHLDCSDLYEKQTARMQQVENTQRNTRLRLRNSSSEYKELSEGMMVIVSWFEYRSIDKEIKKIRSLESVQEQVRSDLTRLSPVYQRCKKLSAEDQAKCLETVQLDLYNLYTNYFKQEKDLFPKA